MFFFFFSIDFIFFFFFFFQAEDGIRDLYVTGVQTCALPILPPLSSCEAASSIATLAPSSPAASAAHSAALPLPTITTSNCSRTGFNQQLRQRPHVTLRVDRRDRIGNRRDHALAQHHRRAQLELAP